MVLVVSLVQANLESDDLQLTSSQGRTVYMTCVMFLLQSSWPLHLCLSIRLRRPTGAQGRSLNLGSCLSFSLSVSGVMAGSGSQAVRLGY